MPDVACRRYFRAARACDHWQEMVEQADTLMRQAILAERQLGRWNALPQLLAGYG